MTIKELILKLRFSVNIEIRNDHQLVIAFHSDHIEAIKDDIVENEIDYWFVEYRDNKPYVCFKYTNGDKE